MSHVWTALEYAFLRLTADKFRTRIDLSNKMNSK